MISQNMFLMFRNAREKCDGKKGETEHETGFCDDSALDQAVLTRPPK
jgi:hypothetical protein